MGPLAGIKILDLSQVVSGPMATAWLADQGADVLKLESPAGDPSRLVGAKKGRLSALYVNVNRNKRGEILDLKDKSKLDRFFELVRWADVVVENFRPNTLEKQCLGYTDCAKIKPNLIWCTITGFGPDGPYANLRAYDPIVQAASGFATVQGDANGGKPQLIGTIVCDKVAALTAAQAITAALLHRERTGKGQRIEISMLDAALTFSWPEGMYNQSFVEPADPVPEYASMGRLWQAKDGYVALSALQDIEFTALRQALGNPESLSNPAYDTAVGRSQNIVEMFTAIASEVAKRTKAELMEGFIKYGAVGCVVNDRDDLLSDPQVKHNKILVEINQGRHGMMRLPRHPIRFGQSINDNEIGPAPDLID